MTFTTIILTFVILSTLIIRLLARWRCCCALFFKWCSSVWNSDNFIRMYISSACVSWLSLGSVTGSSYWVYMPIVKFIDRCRFAICGHNMLNLWLRCQVTGVAMATVLYPSRWRGRVVVMSATEYEVDTTNRYWVMAHFNCIHYVPEWPWPSTYFPGVAWPGADAEFMCLFLKLTHLCVFIKICGNKMPISWLRCHGNHFVPH